MRKRELLSVVVVLIGMLIYLLIIYLLVTYIDLNSNKGLIYVGLFILYISLTVVVSKFLEKYDNVYIKYLNIFLVAPTAIIILIINLTRPFAILFMRLVVYLVFSSIVPILLILLLNYLGLASQEMIFFIYFSLSSIIAITFHKPMLNTINNLLNNGYYTVDEEENRKSDDLVIYILSINNIRFYIYTMYFIFLVIFSFKSINESSLFSSEKIDYSMLQAFLVFLAYDNLRINSKDLKLLGSTVLHKMLVIIDDQYKNIINKDNEK